MTDRDEPAAGADAARRRLAGLLARQGGPGERRLGPVSFAQRRLWIFEQLAPESGEYNVYVALRIEQDVDADALGRALGEIVRRHEVLRTVFPAVRGTPVQDVRDPYPVAVEVRDLSAEPDPERAARRVAAEEVRRPFDLASGPLLRALLLQLANGDRLLLLVTHHIAFDGWSGGILFRELDEAYAAFRERRRPELPALPVQYLDFAVWQRQYLQGPLLEEQVAYWRRALAGVPELLKLPFDYTRPPVRDVRGAWERIGLDAALVAELRRVASAEGTSLFVVLLAGVAALLGRYCGQRDVPVGVPVGGRARPEFEDLIGFFVNTLVLRADLGGNPGFRELVRRLRDVTVGAFGHQEVPFEKLVEELRPERDPALSPFFQVVYNFQVSPPDRLWLPALRARLEPLDAGTTRFDLELSIFELENGVEGVWNYKQALFHPDTARRMVGHLRRLLEGAAADPERAVSALPLLTPAERHALAGDPAPEPTPPALVLERIERCAAATPRATAVAAGGELLTYAELSARVRQLALRLRAAGVRQGSVVGVCLERTPALATALLAVLEAGGTALPVAPASWPEWGPDALESAGATHLVADETPTLPPAPAGVTDLRAGDGGGPATDERPPAVLPEDGAILLFEPDARGEPVGLAVDHAALAARLDALERRRPLEPGEGVLGTAPPATEPGVWQLLWPLATGGRAVLPEPGREHDPDHLLDLAAAEGVGTLWLAPHLLRDVLLTGRAAPGTLRRVLCSGDPLSTELVQRCRSRLPDVELGNAYVTPATGPASEWRAGDGARAGRAPLGAPAAGLVRLGIVDEHGEPAPPGVVGELVAGGPQVACGFAGRPALTAERFVPDPDGPPGARRFRTGERARIRGDGQLELLGAVDHPVTIRGVPVELGEIEEVLAAHPSVAAAVVAAAPQGDGGDRLTAYVLREPGAGEGAPEQVLTALGTHTRWLLPADLVPTSFALLERFPLTAAGTLDWRALPAAEQVAEVRDHVPPRDEMERAVAGLWESLLERDGLGVHDNFFEQGGTSLLTIQLSARVSAQLGIELPAAELFRYRTIADLAARLTELGRGQEGARRQSPLVRARDGAGRPPIVLVHPAGGSSLCYRDLAAALGDRTVYTFEARRPVDQLSEIAGAYVEALLAEEPDGDVCLGGYSLGGVVAFEMACRLVARGFPSVPVVAVDTHFAQAAREDLERDEHGMIAAFVRSLQGELGGPVVEPEVPAGVAVDRALLLATDHVRAQVPLPAIEPGELLQRFGLYRANVLALAGFRPQRYGGRLVVVEAEASGPTADAWLDLADRVERVRLPGDHHTVIRGASAADVARVLEAVAAGASPETAVVS